MTVIPEQEPVAVTGLGLVTPLGRDLDAVWGELLGERSGVVELPDDVRGGLPVRGGGVVNDADGRVAAESNPWRERFTALGLVAARDALDDARLEDGDVDPARVGVVIGTGIGGIAAFETQHAKMLERGPRSVRPAFIGKSIPNAAAGAVAQEFGFTGPNLATVTACASGAHAITRAVDLIRSGRADVVIAGGTEASLTPLSLAAFHALRALSTRTGPVVAASRPFDRERDGFVMGEGAGIMVLENLASARRRGVRVRARVLGYGETSDAHHPVAPHPDGAGAAAAMGMAMSSVGLRACDISLVNAHATSTPVGDVAEARAIGKVFGKERPAVTAVKSNTGHLIGASGAVEAITTVRSVEGGGIPPIANLDVPDPSCQHLDLVTGEARRSAVDLALTNSFAFGGHNVSILIGAPQ